MESMRRLAVSFLAAGVVLIILFFVGCGGGGDPVRSTLDRMTAAAHARDAAAVMANLTADFQGGDGSSRADDEALLRQYFAAYESLDVRLEDVRIERSDSTARVRLRAVMTGRPREIAGLSGLLPSSAKYDFDFRMSKDGAGWKVAWASWAPAE
jgi:hypothetical protein